MTEKAFQDFYADDMSHCYGCGRLNPDGLQIKSYGRAMKACAVSSRGPITPPFRGMSMAG